MENTTTSPVVASDFISGPEFVNTTNARKLFSIGKSHLYNLHSQGMIRSVVLRKRGAARGKRLWDVSSIRALLHANMENTASTAEAK